MYIRYESINVLFKILTVNLLFLVGFQQPTASFFPFLVEVLYSFVAEICESSLAVGKQYQPANTAKCIMDICTWITTTFNSNNIIIFKNLSLKKRKIPARDKKIRCNTMVITSCLFSISERHFRVPLSQKWCSGISDWAEWRWEAAVAVWPLLAGNNWE